MTKCCELMTSTVEVCKLDTTADKIASLMKAAGVGIIAVVDSLESMKIIGVISDRDLVVRVVAPGLAPNETRAREIMTPSPIACKEDDPIKKVVDMMEKSRVRRVFIVDCNGMLKGVISITDIARSFNNLVTTSNLSTIL